MKKILLAVFGITLLAGGFTVADRVAQAGHAWGNYHWGRTANPFTLELGNNVSGQWAAHLATAADDWSVSSVVDTVAVPGKSNRNCKATDGRVEVCNAAYGPNGWLGIAQIWVSGDHITKGAVKVNDTYFDTPKYDTLAWRDLVMCQEVGHTLGLGHTDENFGNTPEGTCMDYSNDPEPNRHPNAHDYDMLEAIYAHMDDVNTYKSSDGGGGDDGDGGNGKGNGKGGGNGKGKPADIGQDIDLGDPSAWGRAVRHDAQGNHSLFVRVMGGGEKVFTFVTWIDGRHGE